MHILEELYLGGVRPGERTGKQKSQYKKALNEAIKTSDALIATLSDEQKQLFENFMDTQREVSILTDVETFIYGFRTGAKIMLDILEDGEIREI
ncbi:MAG: hypothetical protein II885_03140 [Oscillospiraceae bacterium]|nr:hypothetical protein [Oscillospiraceae bacterium]